ncbi:MAG: type II toxin-antitoxin system VapC family toxin, partial [Planctomycetota bacterium]|nr:type II toxin-antitoxin system VapC family toxin [Planctomycetota bacterium]
SYWELAIKISLGKYRLPIPFSEFIHQAVHGNGFLILPIEPSHTAILTDLPFHHRDPFDRLIVAQSIAEKMQLISVDKALDEYPITRRW